ncbi:MAG TPA: tripartite tricarboxylate transporter substrate binding protein [Casimicrobiaceae bacterium]|nr:tripartite tricarboxylate transporter substrate binding protein [Casimicrobiaceae bacterium]
MFATMPGATRIGFIVILLCATFMHAAHAQPYPSKPVRIIVPYTPGGSNDVLGRMVAKHMQETLKQPFIVENKPGAAGQIGAEAAAKSAPDGYTLLVAPNDVMTVTPNLHPNGPYDPENDFEPIGTLGAVPIVLVVNASSSYKSVSDLVAAAKAKPAALSYASSGAGGPQHMSAELFALMSGVKMVHVPYKGNVPALTDLLGGQVDVLFSPINSALPHIKSGKLRALAMASDKRVASLPDVPTLTDSGIAGYKSEIWIGLFAPRGTPKEIIDKLSAEVTRMQAQADIKEQLSAQGIEPMNTAPAQVSGMIKTDLARWQKVIKETGVKAN